MITVCDPTSTEKKDVRLCCPDEDIVDFLAKPNILWQNEFRVLLPA